ncbi:MAG: DJ-1/PfpI family protein [Deltaproteobacteria bacterium]|jgi:4-methyl-5(b-hydroxyethyl)-thiazole monophosphate biosynthesis|nr:DJ-1/PfpI family protein [Deltaproteobacteria bacterium]
MARAALFLIDGFEEIEAVSTADILRRGKVETDLVSLEGGLAVKGKHGMEIKADRLFKGLRREDYDVLIIPGGTVAYLDRPEFLDFIALAGKAGQKIAAICAAPVVLGTLGLLKGKKAVVYPGFEDQLEGAAILKDPVVTDGTLTTSRGPGTAIPFALEVLKILSGAETARKVGSGLLFSA